MMILRPIFVFIWFFSVTLDAAPRRKKDCEPRGTKNDQNTGLTLLEQCMQEIKEPLDKPVWKPGVYKLGALHNCMNRIHENRGHALLSEVEGLKKKVEEQTAEIHDLRLKFGTLTVGEAISKVRCKRHPEQRYEVHSEEDMDDKNDCSVIRNRNQNVAHNRE